MGGCGVRSILPRRRRRGRVTRSLWRWAGLAGRAFRYPFLSVIDFLVEDLCFLCGGPNDAHVPSGPAPEPAAEALLEPVVHLYLGFFAVENHPVCRRCLDTVAPSRYPGSLGLVSDPHTVITADGERFGPSSVGHEAPGQSGPEKAGKRIPLIAPFMTSDNLLKIVHLVKFSRYEALTGPLGRSMAEAYRVFGDKAAGPVVVPVPMDSRELGFRGFNQSERLARVVAGTLDLRVDAEILYKLHRTARQSRTRPEARADNVRRAFACRGTMTPGPVLLVDDLATTGATAAACASQLLAAGASSVEVLCFARAL